MGRSGGRTLQILLPSTSLGKKGVKLQAPPLSTRGGNHVIRGWSLSEWLPGNGKGCMAAINTSPRSAANLHVDGSSS